MIPGVQIKLRLQPAESYWPLISQKGQSRMCVVEDFELITTCQIQGNSDSLLLEFRQAE